MKFISPEFYKQVNAVLDKQFDDGVVLRREKIQSRQCKPSNFLYPDRPESVVTERYASSLPCEIIEVYSTLDNKGRKFCCYYYQPESLTELQLLLFETLVQRDDFLVIFDSVALDDESRQWVEDMDGFFNLRETYIFGDAMELDSFLSNNEYDAEKFQIWPPAKYWKTVKTESFSNQDEDGVPF